ncbi:hypothetical protein A9Q87_09155 [Flavobacteriales bacterium 34_180_T64]|nr:hypothetical protein A9Q87_09155 [Flavobacteriales bacterium 34_180_T64]
MKLEQHKNVFYKNIGTYMALINNELKKEYPLEPLSNHIKMVGGYAFKSSHYLSEGIPIIRISDFQNEKIVLTGVKYYEESNDLERYELTAGDVIIAMTGGTIGKLAIVQDGLGKLYLNQRVGKFQVLNPNEFEDEYVYWLARGIQDIVQNLGYGGAQPNVSNKQIEALEFTFPERKIQRKIIAFLNDLKKNKTNGHYFNANVESKISNIQNTSIRLNTIKNDAVLNESLILKLKEAILQEAVQGKLTLDWRTNNPTSVNASFLLKHIQEEKAQLIKDKKIKKEKPLPPIAKEDIPYILPEGWVWCKIGTITSVRVGSTPDRKTVEYWNGDIPWVSSGEVANNFIYDTKEKITISGFKNSSVKLYPAGTVLVAMIGQGKTRGQTSILKISASTNQNVAGIEIFHQYLISEYLWQFFLSRYETTRSAAVGGNQPALNGGKIKNTLFPLPPLEEQKVIVQRVNTLMGLCDKLVEDVQQSQEQSDKLTQSIMRESLEVNTTF